MMRVSMNGLRSNLTNGLNDLALEIASLLDGKDDWVKEKVTESFNNVASEISLLNCVYSSDDKDFSDLSDKLAVNRLGDDC